MHALCLWVVARVTACERVSMAVYVCVHVRMSSRVFCAIAWLFVCILSDDSTFPAMCLSFLLPTFLFICLLLFSFLFLFSLQYNNMMLDGVSVYA